MISEEKTIIRQQIKEIKRVVSLEEKKRKSQLIFSKLEQNYWFVNSKSVMLYWSMSDEVFTHDFILKWYLKKQIILPSIAGNILKLKIFSGIDSMIAGESMGIMEPMGSDFIDTTKIDLIIVPGIAFDKSNNRLGRGKAYYDNFLINCNAFKIGVCFDFQIIETIPVDAHDVPMNLIISA